jgi:class 3 adenylate cyclase
LAKRLEENAESKEIVISQSVYDRVVDLVNVIPREPMKVKGRNAMERTYLLTGFK